MTTLAIIFSILLFLGIIFTAIPTVPGMLYMFVVAVIYGFIDKFETLRPWHLAVFAALVALAIFTDYLAGVIGAKFGGANKTSIFVGILGLFVGLILFPPFGLFIGLFLGVLIAELVQHANGEKALKAAAFSFVGTMLGMGFNVLLAVSFFVMFLFIVF